MAQVAEIKFGQKVMEKETEKKISEIEGLCLSLSVVEQGHVFSTRLCLLLNHRRCFLGPAESQGRCRVLHSTESC